MKIEEFTAGFYKLAVRVLGFVKLGFRVVSGVWFLGFCKALRYIKALRYRVFEVSVWAAFLNNTLLSRALHPTIMIVTPPSPAPPFSHVLLQSWGDITEKSGNTGSDTS